MALKALRIDRNFQLKKTLLSYTANEVGDLGMGLGHVNIAKILYLMNEKSS